jgi:hypothetical protein
MKIRPCKLCESKDIKLYDCGYSSFNCYGGKCRECGYHSGTSTGGCFPTENDKIKEWNRGQKLTAKEKLKEEKSKCRKLRKQLRDNGMKPVV